MAEHAQRDAIGVFDERSMIERPMAPMLVIRVETDWYPHETEFRYVLQPGEGINCSHNIPIGQAFFVPSSNSSMKPLRLSYQKQW